jgi:acetyl-CoA acetyltransferase
MTRNYEGIAVVCPVTTAYTRRGEYETPWYVARALRQLIREAGIRKQDVDGLAVSSFMLPPDPVVALSASLGVELRWMEDVPFGGASGIVALRRAARAVQCGDASIVACIGADSQRPGELASLVRHFSRAAIDGVYPYGGAGPNLVFALLTRAYMEQFQVTREDFGRLCIAQRGNASAVSHALLREPLTMDKYLAARPIAEPLHLYDCVMPCAGAEGFLVMEVDRARQLGLPCALLRGAAERHNAFAEDQVPFRGGWLLDRDDLYTQAGIEPRDVDVLETYDDYPVVAFWQLEDLGFCAKGDAAHFVKETPLSWNGGGLPCNTSGGQLSCGQAGAAGGFLGLVEGLRQVTAQAPENQVPDARLALISGYGMVTFDRCLTATAAVLEGCGRG